MTFLEKKNPDGSYLIPAPPLLRDIFLTIERLVIQFIGLMIDLGILFLEVIVFGLEGFDKAWCYLQDPVPCILQMCGIVDPGGGAGICEHPSGWVDWCPCKSDVSVCTRSSTYHVDEYMRVIGSILTLSFYPFGEPVPTPIIPFILNVTNPSAPFGDPNRYSVLSCHYTYNKHAVTIFGITLPPSFIYFFLRDPFVYVVYDLLIRKSILYTKFNWTLIDPNPIDFTFYG